jgi:hypothetical protein
LGRGFRGFSPCSAGSLSGPWWSITLWRKTHGRVQSLTSCWPGKLGINKSRITFNDRTSDLLPSPTLYFPTTITSQLMPSSYVFIKGLIDPITWKSQPLNTAALETFDTWGFGEILHIQTINYHKASIGNLPPFSQLCSYFYVLFH